MFCQSPQVECPCSLRSGAPPVACCPWLNLEPKRENAQTSILVDCGTLLKLNIGAIRARENHVPKP